MIAERGVYCPDVFFARGVLVNEILAFHHEVSILIEQTLVSLGV